MPLAEGIPQHKKTSYFISFFSYLMSIMGVFFLMMKTILKNEMVEGVGVPSCEMP